MRPHPRRIAAQWFTNNNSYYRTKSVFNQSPLPYSSHYTLSNNDHSTVILWGKTSTESKLLLNSLRTVASEMFGRCGCTGGNRQKQLLYTEAELKLLSQNNLFGAMRYSLVYLAEEKCYRIPVDETLQQSVNRVCADTRFVNFVKLLWNELGRSEQQGEDMTRDLKNRLHSILYKLFIIHSESDNNNGNIRHDDETVMIREGDWSNMYEVLIIVALCKFCYIPYTFVTREQQLVYHTLFDEYLEQNNNNTPIGN